MAARYAATNLQTSGTLPGHYCFGVTDFTSRDKKAIQSDDEQLPVERTFDRSYTELIDAIKKSCPGAFESEYEPKSGYEPEVYDIITRKRVVTTHSSPAGMPVERPKRYEITYKDTDNRYLGIENAGAAIVAAIKYYEDTCPSGSLQPKHAQTTPLEDKPGLNAEERDEFVRRGRWAVAYILGKQLPMPSDSRNAEDHVSVMLRMSSNSADRIERLLAQSLKTLATIRHPANEGYSSEIWMAPNSHGPLTRTTVPSELECAVAFVPRADFNSNLREIQTLLDEFYALRENQWESEVRR